LQDPVSFEDPAGIGVDHEDGLAAGIEQDAVGRFLADPRNRQQPAARFRQIAGEHRVEVAPEAPAQHLEKRPEPPCLDPVVPRRPDQFFQLRRVEAVKR